MVIAEHGFFVKQIVSGGATPKGTLVSYASYPPISPFLLSFCNINRQLYRDMTPAGQFPQPGNRNPGFLMCSLKKLSPGLAYNPTAACPHNLLTTNPALRRHLFQYEVSWDVVYLFTKTATYLPEKASGGSLVNK